MPESGYNLQTTAISRPGTLTPEKGEGQPVGTERRSHGVGTTAAAEREQRQEEHRRGEAAGGAAAPAPALPRRHIGGREHGAYLPLMISLARLSGYLPSASS